eukprot:6207837-Pleurochrysis_carterae.AAC.1
MSSSGAAMASVSVAARDGRASAVSGASHRWHAALCALLTPFVVGEERLLANGLRGLLAWTVMVFF